MPCIAWLLDDGQANAALAGIFTCMHALHDCRDRAAVALRAALAAGEASHRSASYSAAASAAASRAATAAER